MTKTDYSGVNDFGLALCLHVDRKDDSYDDKDNNDTDEIDEDIQNGTVTAVNEELVILVKDRIDDREPQREYDVHLIVGS